MMITIQPDFIQTSHANIDAAVSHSTQTQLCHNLNMDTEASLNQSNVDQSKQNANQTPNIDQETNADEDSSTLIDVVSVDHDQHHVTAAQHLGRNTSVSHNLASHQAYCYNPESSRYQQPIHSNLNFSQPIRHENLILDPLRPNLFNSGHMTNMQYNHSFNSFPRPQINASSFCNSISDLSNIGAGLGTAHPLEFPMFNPFNHNLLAHSVPQTIPSPNFVRSPEFNKEYLNAYNQYLAFLGEQHSKTRRFSPYPIPLANRASLPQAVSESGFPLNNNSLPAKQIRFHENAYPFSSLSTGYQSGTRGPALNIGHQFGARGPALNIGHQFGARGPALNIGHQFGARGPALNIGHQFGAGGPALNIGHQFGARGPTSSIEHQTGATAPKFNLGHQVGAPTLTRSISHQSGTTAPKQSSKKVLPRVCTICQKVFFSKKVLFKHRQAQHTARLFGAEQILYTTDHSNISDQGVIFCTKKCAEQKCRYDFDCHYLKHLLYKAISLYIYRYNLPIIDQKVCPVCGVHFRLYYRLRDHFLKHVPLAIIKCRLCNENIKKSSARYHHLKVFHSLQCEQCDEHSFEDVKMLKSHYETTHAKALSWEQEIFRLDMIQFLKNRIHELLDTKTLDDS